MTIHVYSEIEEILDALNEERILDSDNIPENLLDRKIWVAYHGWTGCLSEGFGYSLTKKDAIDSLLGLFDDVVGLKTALKNHGIYFRDGYRYAIEKTTLADAVG